jgi:hypothetical protein
MTITTQSFTAINVGTTANDGTGDDLRTAFIKVNDNFQYMGNTGFNAGNIAVNGSIEIDGNATANGGLNIASVNPGYPGVLNVGGMNFLASSNTIQGVNYASLGEISGTKLSIGAILIADTGGGGTIDMNAPTVFIDSVVADLYDGDTPSGYGGNIILRSGHNPEVSNLFSLSAGTVTGGNISIGGYGTNGIRNYYGNIIIEPNGVTKFSGTGNVELYGNSLVFSSPVPNPIVFYDGTTQNSAYPGNHFANNTPASSTASGIEGDIWYDASYIYICVATNSWIRAIRQAW